MVNNTAITNTLHRIFMLTFRYENQRMAEIAYEDLVWYINTGRASTAFLKALCSLKGNQRAALLRMMVNAECNTTDAHVKIARAYLEA